MLHIEYTTQFKRDLKLAKHRKNNLSLLQEIMETIASEKSLHFKYKDHLLAGNWQGHRELHIQPDWLLIYRLVPQEQTVIFTRLGTHSDLFD